MRLEHTSLIHLRMSFLERLGNPQPILKVLFDGLYDEDSNLSKLRGCEHVIQAIWREVKKYYQSAVKISPKFQCFCPRKCFLFLFDDWKREAFEQIWNEKRKLKEQQRSQQ